MSDAVWFALIAMIGASIANITTSILGYLKSRDAERAAQEAKRHALEAVKIGDLNRNAIQQVEIKVDGRLTQLLEITGQSARSEGIIVGSAARNIADKTGAEAIAAQAAADAVATLERASEAAAATLARAAEAVVAKVEQATVTAQQKKD